MNIPRHCQEEICKEFFTLFARFEYAMKAAGFREDDNGRIVLLWNQMADSMMKHLTDDNNVELQTAVTYIITQPPKKQSLVNDKIVWVDAYASQGNQIYDLFVYIRRIRNNLFHGGKYKGRYLSDPERSLELINHSSTVLNSCVKVNQDLYEAFHK